MSRRELLVVAALALGGAGGARAAEPLTLPGAVAQALARSVEVQSAAAEVRAAEARLAGASAPLASNPELSGGVGARRGDAGRTAEYEVALAQRIEVGGQRGARVAAARAALAAARARLAAARAEVAAEARTLLGRAVAAGLRAELATEARRLAEDAARAAERRFEAGDVARVEVNGARIDAGRAARAALEAEEARAATLVEVELLLALEPGAAPALAFELGGEGAAAELALEPLVAEALASRGDLVAARREVDAAEAEARAAARAVIPSPELGLSLAREEGADVVMGTVAFELPVFARGRAERGAASARVDQARLALAAQERRVAQEVRLAAARVRAARAVVAAFDAATVAALAENLALVTRAYEAGQLDFVRYQLLRRETLEARADRVDALEALNEAEARLARALGREP